MCCTHGWFDDNGSWLHAPDRQNTLYPLIWLRVVLIGNCVWRCFLSANASYFFFWRVSSRVVSSLLVGLGLGVACLCCSFAGAAWQNVIELKEIGGKGKAVWRSRKSLVKTAGQVCTAYRIVFCPLISRLFVPELIAFWKYSIDAFLTLSHERNAVHTTGPWSISSFCVVLRL